MPSIVLIGGGHAHVNVIKTFGTQPIKQILRENNVKVTLITRDIQTPYSGMLPGYVSGIYTLNDIHIDLHELCTFSDVELIHASATKIEYFKEKGGCGVVHCSDDKPPIKFDVLSINVGISPQLTNDINLDYFTPVKPISSFSTRWEGIKSKLQDTIQSSNNYYTPDRPFILLVVGGGAGGVELTLAAQYSLQNLMKDKKIDTKCIKVILATKSKTLLSTHNSKVGQILANIFEQRGIPIYYDAEAIGIVPTNESTTITDNSDKLQTLLLSNEEYKNEIKFHECLWCTSASAPSWLKQNTPFTTNDEKFLVVEDTYQCVNYPGVFAAGDCCEMIHHPRPKSGVYAVRAGPPLCKNIISYILKQPLKSYIPQKNALALISTGDKYAIYSKSYVVLQGKYLWKLKDYIDRTWMYQYQHLPTK